MAVWMALAVTSTLVAEARLVEERPRIDGHLSEDIWQGAAAATDFVQSEPRFGEPAAQPTRVYIAYTKDTLLVGARLHDDEPERIVGTEYRRDALLEAEDSFEIYLDTFHDGRNAFYFATNPVGARLDALMSNEGAILNYEWDGVWEVACTRDDTGWVVEIAIPFNTLRFRTGSGEDWGLNFGRRVARTREETYWARIDPDWGFSAQWRASQWGDLRGLESASPGGRLKLKPFLLSGAERDFETAAQAELDAALGLDAKIAFSSSLNLDVTVNTDFAQVESDQQQVNLTRFPLFFPEKREFFLENAGLFRVGETSFPYEPPGTILFFSRQLGLSEDGDEIPILAGARLTGRMHGTELGAFHIVTEETALEDALAPETGFSAFRIKQDVLERSSVGGMFLNKSPAQEGPSNQVAVADVNLAFTDNASVNAFLAKSRTPGLEGSDHAANVHAEWATDAASVYGDYADIGDDFNSEMGFVPRTGIRKGRLTAFWSPRPRVLGMRQAYIGTDHLYIVDQEGDLESQYDAFGPYIIFDNGSILSGNWVYQAEGLKEPFEIRDGVEIPTGDYRFQRFDVGYQGDQSRRFAANAFYSDGGFYDGTLRSLGVGFNVKPHPRLQLNVFYARNDVDLPEIDGGTFTTNLVVARGVYAFSSRAFVRALVQLNDDSREALANVLFRYNYRPGSDLFVVYNEDRDTTGTTTEPKHRELLVKLTFYSVPF